MDENKIRGKKEEKRRNQEKKGRVNGDRLLNLKVKGAWRVFATLSMDRIAKGRIKSIRIKN